VEGCYLLGRQEAADRMPVARRSLLGSRMNGRGWRAWDDHTILVPLHGARGELVGVIWVDDPGDRLLPSADRLQALHAFANQATAAMIAADRYERLSDVSEGDPVTGLGNRRAFLRELEREVARSARTGGTAILVLLDVEGCAALDGGAEVLDDGPTGEEGEHVAVVLERALRRHDRAFRVDGTLFAALLTGGDADPHAEAVARRLTLGLAARTDFRVHFGLAVIGPAADGPQDALRRAGEGLVAAKRAAGATGGDAPDAAVPAGR
jgi:GGDEF domain-containing protein